MLDAFRDDAVFAALYRRACELAGEDLLERLAVEGMAYLRRNEIVSLVTMVVNLACLERLVPRVGVPVSVAGYSVGQWAAMAAAGMVSYEQALEVVWRRAQFMNATSATDQGAMLAVIGLPTDQVEAVVQQASLPDEVVAVSNYNCLGQLTLSGHREAVARAQMLLEELEPRRLVPLPVQGAWHCPLLSGAREPFRAYLEGVTLADPKMPVADNVTGNWLPRETEELRDALADHVVRPVRWMACVQTMVAHGAEMVAEVGHGNVLTKFGFFIDRSIRHVTIAELIDG